MISQEYIAAIALILISVLKVFGIEIENQTIEALIAGVLALWIAIRRKSKGDITALGFRKFRS